MDKDTKIESWAQKGREYISSNPEQAEVWGAVIEATRVFEEKHGFTRRQICEGLFNAALDLAYWRDTDPHLQKPEDVRAFYKWALGWLKMTMEIYITPEEQEAYEKQFGKNPDWLFQAKNFKDKSDDTVTH